MKKLILGCILVGLLLGCSNVEKEQTQGLKVYTSIYPINYIVSEIGKDKIAVENIIPTGTEPHDFEPSIKTIEKVKSGDLFLYNGVGLETWGDKLAIEMDSKRVMKVSDYVELLDISGHAELEEPDKDEHQNGKDPHLWMSPINMNEIGREVMEKLVDLDPQNRDYYQKNYNALSEKLKALDLKYKTELKQRTSNKIMVSHSAFGYLAEAYGLEQISVSGLSPYAEPSPKMLSKLIDLAKADNLKYIYFEVLASPKSAEMISQEAGLEILTLNPIEGLTAEDIAKNEDYISLMEQNLENLKKELLK